MAVACADGETQTAIELVCRVKIARSVNDMVKATRHERPSVAQTLPSFSVMHQLSSAAHSPIWDTK
jgi:hypothetical protein